MFTATDYDRLQQIMDESPEKKELILRLLESHRMNLSMISHEIRNPLTMVYSSLQLIESQHPEVLDFRHWQEMRRDIEYMDLLLTDLSSYNNGETLSLSPVDMTEFLRNLALSFASSVSDSGLEFTSRIGPDLPVLDADPLKLRQVLLNLLANARDALTDYGGSAHPSITLEADSDGGCLWIRVSDNGCGIPAEEIDGIFQPFVTHKATGTGLGLAIARRIVSAHKGRLTAVSRPGGPTVFTVTLPVQEHTA